MYHCYCWQCIVSYYGYHHGHLRVRCRELRTDVAVFAVPTDYPFSSVAAAAVGVHSYFGHAHCSQFLSVSDARRRFSAVRYCQFVSSWLATPGEKLCLPAMAENLVGGVPLGDVSEVQQRREGRSPTQTAREVSPQSIPLEEITPEK